ncbi:hypothetical protein ACKFKF_26180 [Phormidesmis sp. 146-12]
MKSYIIAQVHMRAEADGGRHCEFLVGYAPHLVVPPDSTYLGVRVFEIEDSDGYRVVYPGRTAKILFQLMYYPRVDYSAFVKDAKFNIQEGPHIVGTGRVLERK